tara:strand:+ start:618 stop:965 length:348 start_codon:yes stop_codon:yes gene_type:complete
MFLFPVLGCEKNENIEEYIFKTWELDWKQCGIYQNKYDIKINFTQTDSIHFGWLLEQGRDSVNFNFEILNNNTISLFASTDSIWNGVINVININTGLLVFEKEIQECTSEMYRFQ